MCILAPRPCCMQDVYMSAKILKVPKNWKCCISHVFKCGVPSCVFQCCTPAMSAMCTLVLKYLKCQKIECSMYILIPCPRLVPVMSTVCIFWKLKKINIFLVFYCRLPAMCIWALCPCRASAVSIVCIWVPKHWKYQKIESDMCILVPWLRWFQRVPAMCIFWKAKKKQCFN